VDRSRRRSSRCGPDLGPIVILINNAGIVQFGKFSEITDEQWDRIMAINLRGPFICTQVVLPDMLDANWGRIVNLSSSSAQGGQSHMAAYVSSKAGVIGLTKSLALELGPKGITVNTIPPGMVGDADAPESHRRGAIQRPTGALRQDHAGAPRGPTRGYRQCRNLPVPGRILLRHRPDHRCERWAANMSDHVVEGSAPPNPLLSPLQEAEWGDAEYAAFGALLGLPGEKVPQAGSGHALDPLKFEIIGVLARHPKMARKFLAYNGYLLQRGELPIRLRELAILRVAHKRRSAFFWGEHVKVATDAGMTADDIACLARGNAEFDGVDLAVLTATDELIVDGRAHDTTWHHLVDELGTHPAIELVFVVGTYTTLAMAFDTWKLAPPEGSSPLPAPIGEKPLAE
jgi:4-carboxymuconolactone decarboxylase